MPPAWKTFDEDTAAALRHRVDGVSTDIPTEPLFANGDSVVIAPTLQKGAAIVITARRRATSITTEEPVEFSPLVEEIAAPQISNTPAVELAPEPAVKAEEPEIALPMIEVPPPEPELVFGPTSWERSDEVELPAVFTPQSEIAGTAPEVWETPKHEPSGHPLEEVASEQPPVTASSDWAEERFVATGFLGLENYVEDDEEISRKKRPWWKRIFSN